MNNEQPLHIKKAVRFFTDASLERLLLLLKQKYIDKSGLIGSITLSDSTDNERDYLSGILDKHFAKGEVIKIPLAAFDVWLRKSGFHCSLTELLTAFFSDGPLETKRELRDQQATRYTRFREQLEGIALSLPDESLAHLWLTQGAYGLNWLFTRFKRLADGEPTQQDQCLAMVRHVASVINQLPTSGTYERLAVFAEHTSGDPHALDRNREAGRIFLYALTDLARLQRGEEQVPQNRTAEIQLYRDAGLLVDTVSSSVLVFHLAHASYVDGTLDPLIEAAGGRVLLLPLRQVQEWQTCASTSEDVYVVENPQVFESLVAVLATREQAPTLLCTSGWPSAAAYALLQQLIAYHAGIRLHYSGDFDLKGLQIAAALLEIHPQNCYPWCFDAVTYSQALHLEAVKASIQELTALAKLPSIFAPLTVAIQEEGKWAYQEGIVHLLLEDIEKNMRDDQDDQ